MKTSQPKTKSKSIKSLKKTVSKTNANTGSKYFKIDTKIEYDKSFCGKLIKYFTQPLFLTLYNNSNSFPPTHYTEGFIYF